MAKRSDFFKLAIAPRLLAVFLGTIFLGNGFYTIQSSNHYQGNSGTSTAELIIQSRPQADWFSMAMACYFFGVATSSKVTANWLKAPFDLLLGKLIKSNTKDGGE